MSPKGRRSNEARRNRRLQGRRGGGTQAGTMRGITLSPTSGVTLGDMARPTPPKPKTRTGRARDAVRRIFRRSGHR